MTKKYFFVVAVLLVISCMLSSCQNTLVQHTHNYIVWDTSQNATCIEEGKKIGYCSCGKTQEQTIPQIEHNYLENICTMCGLHFYETDEYRYNQLKPYADKIALYLAKSYITQDVNKAYTVDFTSEKILERDFYFGYVTEITYTITDENQQQNTLKRTFVLRVNQNIRTRGQILEASNGNISGCKDKFNWGEKPTDFSFDFYESLIEPKKVSLYELLSSPEKYAGMCIELTGNYYVLKRDKGRSSITIGSTSNSTSSNILELIYRTGNADLSHTNLIIGSSQVTKIVGHVEFYTTNNEPYIELLKIELD